MMGKIKISQNLSPSSHINFFSSLKTHLFAEFLGLQIVRSKAEEEAKCTNLNLGKLCVRAIILLRLHTFHFHRKYVYSSERDN